MRAPPDSPTISTVLEVIGVIVLISDVFGAIYLFDRAAPVVAAYVLVAGILAAIGYFALARLIAYAAQTAWLGQRLLDVAERIAHQPPMSLTAQQARPSFARTVAQFYYSDGAAENGPFTAAEMTDFGLSDDTPVFREGDSEWRTYKHFPELYRR